jgi:hypothetical protein
MRLKFLLILLILVLIFFANIVFAAQLEVEYPALINNSNPPTSSDTPLEQYLKYIFDFGIFAGFGIAALTLVIAGVLYFIGPVTPTAIEMAKDRISGAISGLLIFVLLYLIITTLNPYLAFWQLNKLEEISAPEIDTKNPGVNFYSSTDCSGIAQTHITSIPDLGSLKNNIGSISISHDAVQQNYFISILYDVNNYWGKCQYINPNVSCVKPLSSFPSSASIHNYSHKPRGDVYIYRNSFFDKNGGYLKISASQIAQIGRPFFGNLNEMFFGPSANPNDCTVPEQEQDCIKWDKKGNCTQRQCPSLAGKNISSIKIEGNYIVLLIYYDSREYSAAQQYAYSYCQKFPTVDDVSREGPNQIKWADIRNRGQDPNYILIIPVENK